MTDKELIQDLFIKKEYDSALSIIKKGLIADKESIFLLNSKGMIHAQKREYKDSIGCFEKCIKLNYKNDALFSNLGFSYMGAGKDDRAIDNFILSIELNDGVIERLLAISELYIKKKNLSSARIYIEKALTLDRDHDRLNLLLSSLYIDSDKSKAISFLKKFVSSNKGNTIHLLSLARLYRDNENYEESIDCLKGFIKNNNTNTAAIHDLGAIYLLLKNDIEAQACFQNVIELDPDYYLAWFGLGKIFYNQGNYDDAVEVLTWANDLEPGNIAVLNFFALTLHHNQKKIECFKYLKESFTIDENNHDTLILAADFAFDGTQLKEAENFLKRAEEVNKNSFEVYGRLGNLYFSTGSIELAIEYLKKSLKINPEYQFSKTILAKAHKKNKNYFEAINLYKETKEVGWEENILECLYFSEQYKEFENFYDKNENILKFSRQSSSILVHAKHHLGVTDKKHFCENPFDYIQYRDIEGIDELPDFNKRFLEEFFKYKMDSVKRNQELLTNGTQSILNIFEQGSTLFKIFEAFLTNEADKYMKSFGKSNDIFIKNWPDKFKLTGWMVEMTKGGFLDAHNHPSSWLSGVYYIKIPNKNKTNEANIKFCMSSENFPCPKKNFPEEEVEVETIESRLILFPSSTYHYTNSYTEDEGRISISFDFMPVISK
jgi:uncharacterized protein (TIGR02466 family)